MAMGWEIGHAFHYAGLLPVLLGLWWYRGKLRTESGMWVGVALCSLQTLSVLALANSQGYVSDRHIMILVLGGCYAAAAGLRDLPVRLLALAPARAATFRERWPAGRFLTGTALQSSLLIVLVLWCLPKTLQPLHANRAGHHAAGLWLADHVLPGDTVLDDHCWAHYYAGQVFVEEQFQKDRPTSKPVDHEPTRYVVISRSRDPEIAQLRRLNEEQIRAQQGRVVYHWPARRSVDTARVVVYAVRERQPIHP
jgi:hypothetical protein